MTANRLLVVDDEPEICDFIREVAEENGFGVAIAENYDQFRAAYRSLDPTLVVLDLHMPEVDGIELLRYLVDERCGAQILLASGVDSRVLTAAKRLGAAHGLNMLGALQKPIGVPQLEEMLRAAKQEERSITERDLREAIEHEQLTLHYQPKVSLQSSRQWAVDSVEALVRWQHPAYGLVMPDEFIPLAEDSGLIARLTDVVLEAALYQTRLWHDGGFPVSVAVAVNLAPQAISDLELPDRLSDLLREHNLEASKLILEITESAAMADAVRTMDILTRLRLKGIGLSMDDFGTGYSSLVQLYRMPFGELKIDKSFVMDLGESDEAEKIVRSIVNLGHNLGLSVCAEGVETEEAVDLLRSIGCEKAQGYLISKPVPAKDMTEMLRAWGQGDA